MGQRRRGGDDCGMESRRRLADMKIGRMRFESGERRGRQAGWDEIEAKE